MTPAGALRSRSAPHQPALAAAWRCCRRRGRNAEGGSECPFLTGQLGTAWTRGLQEGRGEEKRFTQVAVTLKHFDANSLEGQVRILLTRLFFSSAASESCFLLHDLFRVLVTMGSPG